MYLRGSRSSGTSHAAAAASLHLHAFFKRRIFNRLAHYLKIVSCRRNQAVLTRGTPKQLLICRADLHQPPRCLELDNVEAKQRAKQKTYNQLSSDNV